MCILILTHGGKNNEAIFRGEHIKQSIAEDVIAYLESSQNICVQSEVQIGRLYAWKYGLISYNLLTKNGAGNRLRLQR